MTNKTPEEQRAHDEEQLRMLELDLLDRDLAERKLKHFVARFTHGYKPNWHIDEICAEVESLCAKIPKDDVFGAEENAEELDCGEPDTRLMVEAPPRSAKSQIISRCLPLWYLGQNPHHEVIVATYGQDLANTMGKWAKHMVQDPSFKCLFPDFEISKDSRAVDMLGTTKGGAIRYVGVGGPLSGKGGHLIIIDDPIKDAEDADSEASVKKLRDWYTSVLRTRLAPGAAIIILHTRWRTNDLIGWLMEKGERAKAENDPTVDQWNRITFRAINDSDEVDEWGRAPGEPLHPARFGKKALAKQKGSSGPRDWEAMYQQRPANLQGNHFKDHEFHYVRGTKYPKNVHWHLAGDGSFSKATHADKAVIWPYAIDEDGHIWFSPDFAHEKMGTEGFTDKLVEYIEKFKPQSFCIESGSFYLAIADSLRRKLDEKNLIVRIVLMPTTKDKYARSRVLHGAMQAQRVHWPDTNRMKTLVAPEFKAFTGINDDADDLVDTCSHAANAAVKLPKPYPGEVPEEIMDLRQDADGWDLAEIYRRAHHVDEEEKAGRHSPRTLRGEKRRKGTKYRYC